MPLDADVHALIVEVVEKMALVRRDLAKQGDLERYAARMARVEQKIRALADAVAATDASRGQAITKAWDTPARSLAERNAGHQRAQEKE